MPLTTDNDLLIMGDDGELLTLDSEEAMPDLPGTCGPVKTTQQQDYAVAPGASRTFLQRLGLYPTVLPVAASQPDALRAHERPLRPPWPSPALLQPGEAARGPSDGQTLDWPHPAQTP